MVNSYLNPSDISSKDRVESELEELLRNIYVCGCIPQKELRSLLPYGEAKASLLLSVLEARHQIRKVRIGRENLIEAMP
jgi:uncharacterized membrane protein